MPVRHADFVFLEESFPREDYPQEIPPTADSDRFPLVPPKPRADAKLSKTAQQLAVRVAEAAGLEPEEVPEGLLRCYEAADAWPEENLRGLGTGRVRSISTEAGEMLYVDVVLNALAITHDPNNGRTVAEARAKRQRHLPVAGDDELLGVPVIMVNDAAEFVEAVEESAAALGFMSTVTGKDLQDLNWVGLQGVHEPILVIPMKVVDAAGRSTWVFVVADGNRRLAMDRRALREATNMAASDIESWSDHLRRPDGTLELRDMNDDDVVAARRKAQFRDLAGGQWHPKSHSTDDVEEWLKQASTGAQKTVARCRAVPARLVVGYRNLRASADEPSASMEAVHRYVRRMHIKEAAQLGWSDDTQAVQVGIDTMRKVLAVAGSKGFDMPIGTAELQTVFDNDYPRWTKDTPDGPMHPLRLGSKVLATFICTGHDAEHFVKKGLVAYSMSVRPAAVRKNRAEVGAAMAMPVLGQVPSADTASDFNRARTVVDRLSRHPMFVALGQHPGDVPWWRHIDTPLDELEILALDEYAAGMGDDATVDEKSVGPYGPATRALLFMSSVAQATNPSFRPRQGETASPWQLTLNGLGGSRGGATLTTPDLVMRQVLRAKREAGVRQLAEVVRAALRCATPANILDRSHVATKSDGTIIPGTEGTLTEYFLRSKAMGWDPTAAKSGKAVVATVATDPWDQALELLAKAIEAAHDHTVPFTDSGVGAGGATGEPSIAERYRTTGLQKAYTDHLLPLVERMRRVLERGADIAEDRAEVAEAQLAVSAEEAS